MTEIQQRTQCDGPGTPTAAVLAEMLHTLPAHVHIRAISIKGQGGAVVVEYFHEGLDMVKEFTTP